MTESVRGKRGAGVSAQRDRDADLSAHPLVRVFRGLRRHPAGPGLSGSEIDLALFKLSLKTFAPWVVGIIGAARVLTALVPGSMIFMTAATLLADNLYRLVRPSADDAEVFRLPKLLVPVVALAAIAFTLMGGATIVALLLMGYSFVTQFLPSLVCSLVHRDFVTRQGAIAGILASAATVTLTQTTLGKLFPALPHAARDLNIGIVARAVNIVVLVVVSGLAHLVSRIAAESHARGARSGC